MDTVFCEFCGAEYNRATPDSQHVCWPAELQQMAAEAEAAGDGKAATALRARAQWAAAFPEDGPRRTR